MADTVGRAWGLDVWRRCSGEAWPGWDSDSERAERMRAIALRKVIARIGPDIDAAAPRVLARLARCAGVVAGRTYAWHAEQGTTAPPATPA